MAKNCFIDTNSLIHFKMIDEIDWLKLLNEKQVTLILCPTVISELDKKKIYDTDINIRNRCQKIISKLTEFSDSDSCFIRTNVNIFFLDSEPNIDWNFYVLSKDISDDRILASIINYDKNAVLVTFDFGLKLKSKRFNIKTISLDDSLKIELKKDKDKEEIETLKKQLKKYQNSGPKLILRLKESDDLLKFATFERKGDTLYDSCKIKEIIDNLRQSMKFEQPDRQPQQGMYAALLSNINIVAQEEIERYNKELEKYLLDLEKHYYQVFEYENKMTHFSRIDLFLVNEGTVPARDIEAQAIFKSWFVDFEPFQGRGFVDSELGDIMSFINGFAFKSKDYVDKGYFKIITIKNVQDGFIDTSNVSFLLDAPLGMPENVKLKIGDVLMSLTGNVGRVGVVTEQNLLLNQRVAKITPNNPEWLPFFYFLFRQKTARDYLTNLARGTAQANLSPVETLKMQIKRNDKHIAEYASSTFPLFNTIISNEQQSLTLAAIRDALLPKMMSGEIEVGEDI